MHNSFGQARSNCPDPQRICLGIGRRNCIHNRCRAIRNCGKENRAVFPFGVSHICNTRHTSPVFRNFVLYFGITILYFKITKTAPRETLRKEVVSLVYYARVHNHLESTTENINDIDIIRTKEYNYIIKDPVRCYYVYIGF